MIQITSIIEKSKQDLIELKKDFISKKILLNIPAKEFSELFLIEANKIIISRNIEREFELTDLNKELINQIYHYCTGNKEMFNGQLEKGILLVGKNGVGKTLILRAFSSIVFLVRNKVIKYVHAKKLQSEIRKDGYDNWEKKPLLIDDIGKESKEVIDFGTKILPIADLMALRYDNGALTFATCNYNIKTLEEFYGVTTTDRFKEMFNIIELKGESFRK